LAWNRTNLKIRIDIENLRSQNTLAGLGDSCLIVENLNGRIHIDFVCYCLEDSAVF
jgi:hypothetical protein